MCTSFAFNSSWLIYRVVLCLLKVGYKGHVTRPHQSFYVRLCVCLMVSVDVKYLVYFAAATNWLTERCATGRKIPQRCLYSRSCSDCLRSIQAQIAVGREALKSTDSQRYVTQMAAPAVLCTRFTEAPLSFGNDVIKKFWHFRSFGGRSIIALEGTTNSLEIGFRRSRN